MTTFALANLHDVLMGKDILDYLKGIDATLAPFGGKYVLHGNGNKDVLEGEFSGDLIMISFPDRTSAEGWYNSPDYRKLQPLRAQNSKGYVILVDGVKEGHRATDILG